MSFRDVTDCFSSFAPPTFEPLSRYIPNVTQIPSHYRTRLLQGPPDEKDAKGDGNDARLDLFAETIHDWENNDQVLQRLKQWTDRFCRPDCTELGTCMWILSMYGATSETTAVGDKENMEQKFAKFNKCLGVLKLALTKRQLINPSSNDPEHKHREECIHRIEQVLIKSYNIVADVSAVRCITDPLARQYVPPYKGINLFDNSNKKWGDHQIAYFYALNYCKTNNLRRSGNIVYREIYTQMGSNRIPTHAWEPMLNDRKVPITVAKLIDIMVEPAELKQEFFNKMTSKQGTRSFVETWLTNCENDSFPSVNIHRRIWSFRNGIYILDNGRFQNTFLPWGDPRIDASIVSALYLDYDFTNARYEQQMKNHCETKAYREDKRPESEKKHEAWMSIPTPAIESILDEQKFDYRVQLYYYVFMGRMFWEVNEADHWEGQSFYKGVAGTGKSTSLNQQKYFYPVNLVAIFGDGVERNFPLEGAIGCLIWLGMDISEDFALSQTLWQSMVSGESVPVNRKKLMRISMVWTIPGAMGGNQTPRWSDNAGCISRRMWIFEFMRLVRNPNPNLFNEMKEQTPALLKKAGCAYIYSGMPKSGISPSKWLPEYFAKSKSRIARDTNALEAFLQSPKLNTGVGNYVPLSTFKEAFGRYCRENSYGDPPRFVPDYYAAIFQAKNIELEEQESTRPYPIDSDITVYDTFITGVDIRAPPKQQQGGGGGQQHKGGTYGPYGMAPNPSHNSQTLRR